MEKINGMEFEDIRVEYSKLIKDPKTTSKELLLMYEFFKEHMYVVDNEIRQRAWIAYNKKVGKK